jgi:hypothetical protein
MITIDMTRREGGKGVALVELASKRKQTYIVRTDLQPYQTEEADGVTFIEHRFDYKPSIEEVKEFVVGVINRQTDEKILSGFVWKGQSVWLSAESQRNFSEAHRMGMVPVTFKLWELPGGTAVYHTFETMSELDDFYRHACAYINQCLQEGWQKKDSFDFSVYEDALNEN